MPASDPDASFTIEDLVPHEKPPTLSSSAVATPALNGEVDDASYAARLDELLLDDDDASDSAGPSPNGRDDHVHDDEDEEDDDEDGFVYTGTDAPAEAGYDAKLAELLDGASSSGQPDGMSVQDELPNAPSKEAGRHPFAFPKLQEEFASERSPSTASAALSPLPNTLALPNVDSPLRPIPIRPPFLHPSVSRLRSFVPQHRSRVSSSSTLQTSRSFALSPSPSHFSAISRASSVSAPFEFPNGGEKTPDVVDRSPTPQLSEYAGIEPSQHQAPREVFRWTPLRTISAQVYSSAKASAILDTHMGRPTVMVTGGLVCVGTDTGRTYVFDFRQDFKFICGPNADETIGGVTALCLSQDHTFLAVGHAFGHIFLYDLSKPQTPVRTVLPVTLDQVASARKEGHILGSKIVQLGFVGARHTAIVSADDAGLAFYHSLGKVLFVDATDVIRILGHYPEVPPTPPPHASSSSSTIRPRNGKPPSAPAAAFRFPLRRNKKSSTILAMSSLPISSSSHPTDAFNVIALLTPLKLVIVGLKPTAKTWFRRHRGQDEEDGSEASSTWKGCIAWFPSIAATPNDKSENGLQTPKQRDSRWSSKPVVEGVEMKKPVLAYSWGRTVMLLRVRADKFVDPARSASLKGESGEKKAGSAQQHVLAFEEAGEFVADGDVLSLHWLSDEQLLVVTAHRLSVYDYHTLELVDSAEVQPTAFASSLSHFPGLPPRPPTVSDPGDSLRPSIDVYKGKVFLLGHDSLRVGTLITWADRILHLVHSGDFLGAIDMARTYYTGEARGNKAGLPTNHEDMQTEVGQRIHELMVASAQYVFADERMSDDTHYHPNGRGVDRTSLFEELVATVIRACSAMDNHEFLFEDLYDLYDEHGITGIYLEQLQSAVLSGDLRSIPPRISQRLVQYYDERGAFDMAEQLIWHIDPASLDISQVISLCQRHELYDALIYVYTRALRDYVSPLVELLGVVRTIRRARLQRPARIIEIGSAEGNDTMSIERLVPNAYKVYAYLGDVLSGLTHPSQEPLPEDEAFQAKSDLYTFLFRGQSSVWHGQLVLTADEENGVEHTFPYLRLLIRFDAEAMLHALDQAFEDSFLNDFDSSISRQKILEALLELVRATELSSSDITFIRIFIARNVPKYPQFIRLPRNEVRAVLVGLACDNDQSTREDRQLATEFLLAAYTLKDDAELLKLFEEAEFFRILRAYNLQEHHWGPLISMYLRDDELGADELFGGVEDVLIKSKRGKGVPGEVPEALEGALPSLLEMDVTQTARLLDDRLPVLHDQALAYLRESAPSKELGYLWSLVRGTAVSDEPEQSPPLYKSSIHLSSSSRTRFVSLLCQTDPSAVQTTLSSLPAGFFDLDQVIQACDEAEVYDAVVWALNAKDDVRGVFDRSDTIIRSQASALATSLVGSDSPSAWTTIERMGTLARSLITICSQRSSSSSTPQSDISADEMWFRLLSSQISAVQAVSSVLRDSEGRDPSPPTVDASSQTPLERLRALVQETFSNLVQQSSSKELSFPRLFKRLVDASSNAKYGRKTMYTEFRLILGGMLESYRAEEDVLLIAKRLAEQDLFDDVARLTAARKRGRRMQL